MSTECRLSGHKPLKRHHFVSTDEHCIKLVQQGVHVQLLELLARTTKREVNTLYGATTEYRAIFEAFYLKRLGGSPVALSVKERGLYII